MTELAKELFALIRYAIDSVDIHWDARISVNVCNCPADRTPDVTFADAEGIN